QHVFEKVRGRHSNHCKIAIVRDELHFRRVFVGVAIALDGDVTTVGDNVRVRHDAIAGYDKAGANPTLESPGIPRRFVIRVHRSCSNPNQTLLNRPIWFWRRHRNRNGNYVLCRRARSPWTVYPWCLWALLLHRWAGRRAVLRVQDRRKQYRGVNKNEETLHEQKGGKLKQRTRKSRFGFALINGLFGHN